MTMFKGKLGLPRRETWMPIGIAANRVFAGIAGRWARARLHLAPCPACAGRGRETLFRGLEVVCTMCHGKRTFAAYQRQRAADIEAINRAPRCGCPDCSGEWDR